MNCFPRRNTSKHFFVLMFKKKKINIFNEPLSSKNLIKKLYNILFIIIPFLLLLGTGSSLNTKDDFSEQERRALAKKPESLFNSIEIEKYISDHFPFRNAFLDFYFQSGLGIKMGTAYFWVGKEDWLFRSTNGTSWNFNKIKSYQNRMLIPAQKLKEAQHNLQEMLSWCNEQNIRLYILIPPDKMRVYHHYMPDFVIRDNNGPSIEQQIASIIPEGIRFIPLDKPLEQLAQTHAQKLYYKTESHWAEEAAFVVYNWLLDKIEQDFPNVKRVTRDDFNITMVNTVYSPYQIRKKIPMTRGNLFLKGMKEYENVFYTHFEFKKKEEITINRDVQFRSSTYPNGNLNVYIIGDSYACYLHTFLAATFKQVKAFRYNEPKKKWGISFKDRKKEILENKTDILIVSVSDLKALHFYRDF